ncbi:MAG TPA: regulatory protein RecX [Clostridia bacterium]|nr:regulatory protein RecX [Clostridia bacterium]
MPDSNVKKDALNDALRILGRRMYTKKELVTKLQSKGYNEEIVGEIVGYCEERRYVFDEDYAAFWIEHRCRFKPVGRYYLRGELLQKGVEKEIVEQKLAELFPEEREMELLKVLIQRRHGSSRYRERPRSLLGFLERRGFSFELVQRAYGELGLEFFPSGKDF